ncbi:MOSC domain-containing protein [Pontibacter sp. SGAir0037]|uniref:MOSC domain-containing protein n=1 Tax=Pontibacter sp. SGAir0037 TaxID=2571030 RepID=UPI0010CD5E3B|nr:MOSC N-terminal beta barrel domain-containing protein [Pontibacter sp. SGAir0037]QCR23646.1 MOSC domain-containing protein [Pontibacter sp. SGAir0037]
MNNYTLTEINIYPIKSLGGISLQEAQIEDRGLRYDRRWMLVDETGRFLSQRQHGIMALLQVHLQDEGLLVTHKHEKYTPLLIPFSPKTEERVQVSVWDDTCEAVIVAAEANEWFTNVLQMPARLVYMPLDTKRKVDERYAFEEEVVSFADGYPFLMIGQASLDDLNLRLAEPVPMNRFRPNLVFSGGTPFIEDTWDEFSIGEAAFRAAKPCARCVVVTINQETGNKSAEPLKTLATFRQKNNKIMVGQNLLLTKGSKVMVGDKVDVVTTKA